MSNRIKISLFLALLFSVVLGCRNRTNGKNMPANEETRVLNFTNGKKVYLRAKVWGLAGNHEEIIFSETPITVANKERDYIFYTDEALYKIAGNTLIIYAPQSGKNIPSTPFKDVEIIFNGLKTADEIRDYSINYQKYGLQRVSGYKK